MKYSYVNELGSKVSLIVSEKALTGHFLVKICGLKDQLFISKASLKQKSSKYPSF